MGAELGQLQLVLTNLCSGRALKKFSYQFLDLPTPEQAALTEMFSSLSENGVEVTKV